MAGEFAEGSHRLKLNRALEHLYALHAIEQGWAERDSCVIVDECEIESRKNISRIRIFEQPADPLLRLLLGDVVHNLRQALDHLAYALAIRVAGVSPPPNEESTQFPITTAPEKFAGGVPNKIGPRNRMPAGMDAALESFQPYNGGQAELLGVLHSLDNLDKHRFPPLVAGVARVESFNIGHFEGSHFAGPRFGALEDNAPVVEFTPTPGSEMNMQLQFQSVIAFDDSSTVAPGQPVIELLAAIRNLIRDGVFPMLEAFL
jgi:hypothetical protein